VHCIITGDTNQDRGEDNGADENAQKGLPEPLWLFILEVIAALSLLCLLTLCTMTGLRRCRTRSSGSGTSVPWTRAVSWKENTVISIGQCLLLLRVTERTELYTVLITGCLQNKMNRHEEVPIILIKKKLC